MPQVFISYRQLNDVLQQQRVREFAERVRACGIDVILDQFYLEEQPEGPHEEWPQWCSDRATQTEYVLIIGNAPWFRCFDGSEEPGQGLGAACEARRIRGRLYENPGRNHFARIVYFDRSDLDLVPPDLRNYRHFHAENDFPALISWLGGATPGISASETLMMNWPEKVDELKWPLANHEPARQAFAELVTHGASFRLLAIKGISEMGKSHLTEQFFNNARRRVRDCRCARFDFKGTDQLDHAVANFSQDLGLPSPPAAGSLSDRLRHILQLLAQHPCPSLLIFDTYEDAGDAERWICDSLLSSLHRYDWLRVVIAGQKVPAHHGKLWADDSKVLTLHSPTPADWHSYALANGNTISFSTLTEVHTITQGKASILAELCGPKT